MNYLNLILKNPFRNKTRSILAILGIAIGIATIVALGVISTSLETSTETTLKEGAAEITAMKIGTDSGFGSSSGSLNQSYVDELAKIDGVNQTAGVLQASVMNLSTSGGGPGGSTIEGVDSDKLKLIGIDSVNGSVYSNNSQQLIIGKSLADSGNYTIGDKINLFGEDFEVVGIFETGNMMTDGIMITNLDTLQNLTDNDNYISTVSVKINNNATLDDVNNKIENQYNDTLTTITSADLQESTEETMGVINTAMTAIEALALIIGGLGVINTMMMTVFERTREIGVLKSVGWTNKRVLTMIMGESIVLTIISGIIGTIMGLLAVIILFNVLGGNVDLVYDISIFIKAFVVALIVGILGGLYPAIKASHLSPTESLRYE